ncbi:trace amine-associated receptor 2-like [Cyclopterus lumpus]|uniref:trace amine-associated receptor 2-like n=1 Tax=Cyclopterus lumpus TaxID=8103 RepID=UPI0014872248|nr:trace amine-associated receptor 2-like [Cyclopterus lumpus]XP_034396808.1 trace amine-associated receptor 2-like [Cyclopterus lumpus]XP_034396812.1 trace amine-associated receptor 2-like [Cyclopterus lumpus]
MLLPNITDSGGVPLSVNFDSPEDYLVFIFQIVFATTAVLVAGPVVVTILATRSLRLQNRFIFMLNTSVCDTLVGLSVYYIGLFDVQEGYPPRNGTLNLLPSLLGVKVITFLFAQFDRYFAVCHPFFYTHYITQRVVISANVFCWLFVYSQTIILNFVPLSKALQVSVFGTVSLQVMVLTKVVMTVKLYVVARFQLARDPPSAERESKKESLKIIIFVVISFLVLWGPAFLNIIIRFLTGRGLTFRNQATNPFGIMARFNAVCTPSVYIWGSPALREALVKTVWGRVCPSCRRR